MPRGVHPWGVLEADCIVAFAMQALVVRFLHVPLNRATASKSSLVGRASLRRQHHRLGQCRREIGHVICTWV